MELSDLIYLRLNYIGNSSSAAITTDTIKPKQEIIDKIDNLILTQLTKLETELNKDNA